MHVIVTGGLGFIGSSIGRRFLAEGHDITLIDNMVSSVINGIDGAKTVAVNLDDGAAVAALDLPPADIVMHLGGPSSGPAANKDPVGTIAGSYSTTLNTLRLAERIGARKFLFASSMTVYGNPGIGDGRVDETSPCLPISHYGVAKLACERLVAMVCGNRGIAYNNIRMFNVYGPGQNIARMDQGLVSIFLSLLLKSAEVTVNGSLDRFRDLVHIEDVVSAWVLCATRDLPDGPINIGSGQKTTIGEVIHIIADALGVGDKLSIEVGAGTPGDINGIYADISALKRLASFRTAYTAENGIRQFVLWAKEQ